MATTPAYSGHRLEPRGLSPLLEALGAELAGLLGGEVVAAGPEVVADGAAGLQEPLRVLGGLEALEHAFSFSDGAVAVLRPVVQPLVSPVLNAGERPPQRGQVAGELVGDDHPRRLLLRVEHAAQEALGRLLIAALLDQDV